MAGARPRVVIDSNVWISAWLSAQGAPAELVRRALRHADVVFSSVSFAELESRIVRPKFDRYLSAARREALLHDLAAVSVRVEIPAALSAWRISRDPDDDVIAQTAVAGEARWLVTGDRDLLELAEILAEHGVIVLTPAAALSAFPA